MSVSSYFRNSEIYMDSVRAKTVDSIVEENGTQNAIEKNWRTVCLHVLLCASTAPDLPSA
jgi:hypothetical protein